MVGVICTPPPLQYLKGLFPVPQTKSTRYFLHALCRAELSTQEDRTASLGVAPTRQQEVSQAWDWQVIRPRTFQRGSLTTCPALTSGVR